MAINQLKAGAFLSYILLGLNTLIGLLYTPFLLRMLGQSEYGLYSLAASVIAYLTVLDLGFGNAIVRYTAKFRAEGKVNEQEKMFGMFFLLYIAISAIAFLIALVLVWKVDMIFDFSMTVAEINKMRIILLLMAFNLAFTFPMSIWGSIITAYEDFVFQKIVHIIRTLLNPLVMIVFLFLGYKAIALVVVTTVFNVVSLIINYIYCKRKLHIRMRFGSFKWSFLQEVSIYSFWIFLNAIMDRIYWSTGQFVLGIYKGTATVAVYAVAIQLKEMFFLFSTAISGVFLPRVTAMVSKGASDREISNLFIRTGRIQYLIMAYILTGFILLGRQFIVLWAGADYEEAYLIALLFFIPVTVPLIQNLGIVILQARNQMKFRSLLYIIIALGSLFISIPLAQMYGGIGCAFATALALFLGQIIAMNIYYGKIIHIDIPTFWKEIGKMSLMPLVMGITGWLLLQSCTITNALTFVLCVGVFTLVYLPLSWLLVMNQSERDLFRVPIIKLYHKIFR